MIKNLIILLFFSGSLFAQVEIRPAIARHFFNVSFGPFSGKDRFHYGGTGNGTIGPSIQAEWKLKKLKPDTSEMARRLAMFFHKSILIAIHYSNHELATPGLTQQNDPLYSRFSTKFIHIPLIYHIYNMTPFLLDENFRIGFGVGLVNSFLLKSTLEEEATVFIRDQNNNIIDQQVFQDKANVTSYARKHFLMFSMEMSFAFKRLYISQRAWFSVNDQYMEGLSENWAVPNKYSIYHDAYDTFGKLHYGGGAFIIGWKIN